MRLTHTTLALATGLGLIIAGPALAQDIVDDDLIDEVVEEVVAQDRLQLRLRLREDGCIVDPTGDGELADGESACTTQSRLRIGEDNGQGAMHRFRYEDDDQPEPKATAFGNSDGAGSGGGGGGRGR